METLIVHDSVPSLLTKLKNDTAKKLHILADFDRTLTKAKNIWSLISILYTQGHLSPEYQRQAQALHDHYLPIEKDETIPLEERKQAMVEWWREHKELLIKEWLTKDHIYEAMKSEKLELREWYQKFFSLLHEHRIPLVILSAGWLWILSIEMYLKNHNARLDNIFLVGNDFIRDEAGKAIDFKKPLIHSMNKSETVLKDFPEIYEKIHERKNVILLGDSPSDVQMIDGFAYDTLLKIGFLNTDDERTKEKFMQLYDVLILQDGSLEYVSEILNSILFPYDDHN